LANAAIAASRVALTPPPGRAGGRVTAEFVTEVLSDAGATSALGTKRQFVAAQYSFRN
jgi:hypothetical protein